MTAVCTEFNPFVEEAVTGLFAPVLTSG